MNRLLYILSFCGAAIVLQACMEGVGPSQITDPRILAVRVTTATTATSSSASAYLIDALTHQVDDLKYTLCVSPWLPTETGVECSSQSYGLSTGPTPSSTLIDLDSYPIPDEYRARITALYLRADDNNETITPTIFELDLVNPAENPPLESIRINGMEPQNWMPGPGEHEVTLEYQDGFDATGVLTSFFTTSGSFSPWRSFDGGSSTLTLEEADPAPTHIYVISRVLGKGNTWIKLEVNQ